MRGVIIYGLILMFLLFSGCMGGTTTKQTSKMTPSEVVIEYAKAHRYKDYDKMYDFMSEEFKNKTSKDEFRRYINNRDVALASSGISYKFKEVLNEEINNNQATVEFEYELSTMTIRGLLQKGKITLIKEKTGWKFTFPPSKL